MKINISIANERFVIKNERILIGNQRIVNENERILIWKVWGRSGNVCCVATYILEKVFWSNLDTRWCGHLHKGEGFLAHWTPIRVATYIGEKVWVSKLDTHWCGHVHTGECFFEQKSI